MIELDLNHQELGRSDFLVAENFGTSLPNSDSPQGYHYTTPSNDIDKNAPPPGLWYLRDADVAKCFSLVKCARSATKRSFGNCDVSRLQRSSTLAHHKKIWQEAHLIITRIKRHFTTKHRSPEKVYRVHFQIETSYNNDMGLFLCRNTRTNFYIPGERH
jgi:hypothetical protein